MCSHDVVGIRGANRRLLVGTRKDARQSRIIGRLPFAERDEARPPSRRWAFGATLAADSGQACPVCVDWLPLWLLLLANHGDPIGNSVVLFLELVLARLGLIKTMLVCSQRRRESWLDRRTGPARGEMVLPRSIPGKRLI